MQAPRLDFKQQTCLSTCSIDTPVDMTSLADARMADGRKVLLQMAPNFEGVTVPLPNLVFN